MKIKRERETKKRGRETKNEIERQTDRQKDSEGDRQIKSQRGRTKRDTKALSKRSVYPVRVVYVVSHHLIVLAAAAIGLVQLLAVLSQPGMRVTQVTLNRVNNIRMLLCNLG